MKDGKACFGRLQTPGAPHLAVYLFEDLEHARQIAWEWMIELSPPTNAFGSQI